MNIQNIHFEDACSQLGLLAGRLQDKISNLTAQLPSISSIGDYITQAEGAEINESISLTDLNALKQALLSVFGDGVSLISEDGSILYLKASSYGGDDNPVTDLCCGTYNEVLGVGHFTPSLSLITLNSNDETIHVANTTDPFIVTNYLKGSSLTTWLALNYGQACSEASLWYDTITSYLAGSWTNVSEFTTIIRDKISGGSNAIMDSYNSIKDNIAMHSGTGLVGMAQSLLDKFNISAKMSVDGATGKIVPSTTTNASTGKYWTVTSLNHLVFKNVLKKAVDIVGQILAFVGGTVLKVVGVAMSAVTKLADITIDDIESLGDIKVNQQGFMNVWYGDLFDFSQKISQLPSQFQTISHPSVLDMGFCKVLTSVDNSVNENSNYIRMRGYQNALLSPNAITPLSEWLYAHGFYSLSLDGNDECYAIDCRINQTYRQYLDSIANIYESNTISCEDFEALSDNDKKLSYILTLAIFCIGSCSTLYDGVGKHYAYYNNHPTNDMDTNQSKWLSIFNRTYLPTLSNYFNQYAGSLPGDVLGALVMLLAENEYLITDNLFTWTNLVALKNAIINWFSDDEDPYFSDFYLFTEQILFNKTNYYWSYIPQDPSEHATFWQANDILLNAGIYSDWIYYADSYAANYAIATNATALVRYYPPQVDPSSITTFLRTMKIIIATAAIVVTAVYAYKRITRNSRQMKKYAEYNKAVSDYNADATAQNKKAVKKARKSLMWDTKLYGSSKYLSTLSGAQFGWDSGESTDSNELGLKNAEPTSNSGLTDSDYEFLHTIQKLITG